jgi:hypothetical protein
MLKMAGEGGVPLLDIVATLVTHDRLPSLTQTSGAMKGAQPLARRCGEAVCTAAARKGDASMDEDEFQSSAEARATAANSALTAFLNDLDRDGMRVPSDQFNYVDFLARYAETLVTVASALSWYGSSLLCGVTFHRLILRRTCVGKRDHPLASVWHVFSQAGEEAHDTAYRGRGGHIAIDIDPLGGNGAAVNAAQIAAAGADLRPGTKKNWVEWGSERRHMAWGGTVAIAKSVEKFAQDNPKLVVATAAVTTTAALGAFALYVGIEYITGGALLNMLIEVGRQWGRVFLGIADGTVGFLVAAAIGTLVSGRLLKDFVVMPALVALGFPPTVVWVLSYLFMFGFYDRAIGFVLYRSRAGMLRLGYRRFRGDRGTQLADNSV